MARNAVTSKAPGFGQHCASHPLRRWSAVRRSQYRGSLDSPLKDRLLRQIKRDAEEYLIPVVMLSQAEIRQAFHLPKRASKYKIASVIAQRFPELRLKLPAERRAWEPELHGMIIFDAIAAGLAYLQPDGVREPPERLQFKAFSSASPVTLFDDISVRHAVCGADERAFSSRGQSNKDFCLSSDVGLSSGAAIGE